MAEEVRIVEELVAQQDTSRLPIDMRVGRRPSGVGATRDAHRARRHSGRVWAPAAILALTAAAGASVATLGGRDTSSAVERAVVSIGDAKDHPRFGSVDGDGAVGVSVGDAKDHPRFGSVDGDGAVAVSVGDAKDHPRFGSVGRDGAVAVSVGDAKDHPRFGSVDGDGAVGVSVGDNRQRRHSSLAMLGPIESESVTPAPLPAIDRLTA